MEYVANMSRLGYNVWTCSFRTNVYSNLSFYHTTYIPTYTHTRAYILHVYILHRSFSLIHTMEKLGKRDNEKKKKKKKRNTRFHSVHFFLSSVSWHLSVFFFFFSFGLVRFNCRRRNRHSRLFAFDFWMHSVRICVLGYTQDALYYRQNRPLLSRLRAAVHRSAPQCTVVHRTAPHIYRAVSCRFLAIKSGTRDG